MSCFPRQSYRNALRALAAFAGSAAMTLPFATPAMAAEPANAAVAALSRLSETQLDTRRAPGADFLKRFFPKGCGAPGGPPAPQFEEYCAWSSTDEADFDLLVGMQDRKIVSIVTEPYALDSKVWECGSLYETADEVPSDLQVCSLRSASTSDRANWTKSWKTFLSAVS